MTDRSGRTYEEYRQLYWDERARRKIAEVKVANFESDAYVLSLLTKLGELQAQLDNQRKQTDHWLTLLDKAEAQVDAITDRVSDARREHITDGSDYSRGYNRGVNSVIDGVQAAIKGEES